VSRILFPCLVLCRLSIDFLIKRLDTSHLPALIQTLTTLLQDRSPLALGAVAFAFESVCPTRLELLHPHFRRLSKILVEVDEWGQVVLMELLLRYARTMLARPVWREGERKDEVKESEEIEMDKDLELLLESVKPVFQSRNPAVSTFLRIFF
jgi:AP-3 complex subunit beta